MLPSSSWPTSKTLTILVSDRLAIAVASLLNFSAMSLLSENSFFNILTATNLFNFLSLALYTIAIPPSPITSISSYLSPNISPIIFTPLLQIAKQ